jgi:3-oxoacyl-[acyl-carrier protein] reductase
MIEQKLAGKNAIVTGGSRGIGKGIALILAANGANVALNHYRDNDRAAETAGQIEALGRRVYHAECDVSSPANVNKFYRDAVGALGQIDILVNNAGHNLTENFEDISEASFDRMLGVHVKGTFFMTQAVYRDMKKRGEGRIINVTSQLAYKGAGMLTHYCTAKGANMTFTRALALECAGTGVLVNAVAPGVTNTDLLTPLSQEVLDTLKAAIPLHRFAEVGEIAPAALLLASPEGSFFHGTCISPNGGEVML